MNGFEVFGLIVLTFSPIAIIHGLRTNRKVKKYKKASLKDSNAMSIQTEYKDKDISLAKVLQKTNYPTKEEYEKQIQTIQQSELNSEKYKNVYSFLQSSLENRKNGNLEEELFQIVGRYRFEESIVNKSFSYKRRKRLEQYQKLNNFMNSLSEEEMNSNIYLKNANLFRKLSLEDIDMILKMLQEKLGTMEFEEEKTKRVEIVLPFSEERLSQIPQEVSSVKGIPYYRPQDYKISYIEVLDEEHKYVYKEYNQYVRRTESLISDIYFWELCNQLSMISEQNLYPYHFQVYNNNAGHEFIASFFVSPQEDLKFVNSETIDSTNEEIGFTLNRNKKEVMKK